VLLKTSADAGWKQSRPEKRGLGFDEDGDGDCAGEGKRSC